MKWCFAHVTTPKSNGFNSNKATSHLQRPLWKKLQEACNSNLACDFDSLLCAQSADSDPFRGNGRPKVRIKKERRVDFDYIPKIRWFSQLKEIVTGGNWDIVPWFCFGYSGIWRRNMYKQELVADCVRRNNQILKVAWFLGKGQATYYGRLNKSLLAIWIFRVKPYWGSMESVDYQWLLGNCLVSDHNWKTPLKRILKSINLLLRPGATVYCLNVWARNPDADSVRGAGKSLKSFGDVDRKISLR